jgi:Fe-S-cluster containining protein
MRDWVIHNLKTTSLAERVLLLDDIYHELDQEVDDWIRASGLVCPYGCGTCCTNFEPEVGPSEADYLAVHFLSTAPQLVRLIGERFDRDACIFYEENRPGHCGIYHARPLICRLFGFSAVRDKRGLPKFRLCAHLPGHPKREYTAEKLMLFYNTIPPLMHDYSTRVLGIDPGAMVIPLREAVSSSIDRITNYLILKASVEKDTMGCAGTN